MTTDAEPGSLFALLKSAARGDLPARYESDFREVFDDMVQASLFPGIRILDVGAGREPTVPLRVRPKGCIYVGLDLSVDELRRAPSGSYDEMISGDICHHLGELEGRFDLVLSFQVFEHVKPMEAAMTNVRSYLRPGGQAILHMSGAFSVFGMLNRLLPRRIGVLLLTRLTERDPESIFPAHYHRCWYSALRRMAPGWRSFDVTPRWRGASYFRFSRHVRALYLVYEEWTLRGRHRDLASYYLVVGKV